MWGAIRVVISIIAGFFLMWPLGYAYGVLGWSTFHGWGLLHGGVFSAWPTLSILVFVALGWLKPFPRLDDTPLLLAAMFCGLVLTGFLAITHRRSDPTNFYALMVALVVVVGAASLFARRKLRVAVFAILPFVFFRSPFFWFPLKALLFGISADLLPDPPPGLRVDLLMYELKETGIPVIFALAGCLAGSVASKVFRR